MIKIICIPAVYLQRFREAVKKEILNTFDVCRRNSTVCILKLIDSQELIFKKIEPIVAGNYDM